MLRKPASGWPIARAAAELGVVISDPELAALGVWFDALAEWNAKIDLTAAKDAEGLVALMCVDAWKLGAVVPRGSSVVDVGAGAGAPGLTLAIMRRDLRVTLVEPLGKRAAFLRTVIGLLDRTDVSLLAERAEDVKGRFDVALARATFAPPEWLDVGKKLVREGGSVWVFLGEDAKLPHPDVAERIDYSKRCLVRYESR
jgi:16S rRNA (guanine527-N7)-methyltransferase